MKAVAYATAPFPGWPAIRSALALGAAADLAFAEALYVLFMKAEVDAARLRRQGDVT